MDILLHQGFFMFRHWRNQHTTSFSHLSQISVDLICLLFPVPQSDALELEGLGSGSAMTTNMASILHPPEAAVPEPDATIASAPTSKSGLLVISPMDGPVAAAAAAAAAVAADETDKDKNYVPGRPFSADAPPGERPFKYVDILNLKI